MQSLLCDFHREQAWERWASKTANGVVAHKEELLALLRRTAHACFHEGGIRVRCHSAGKFPRLEKQQSLTSLVPRHVAGRARG